MTVATVWSTWKYVEMPRDQLTGPRPGWQIIDSTLNEHFARQQYEKLRDKESVTVRVRLIAQTPGESPRVEALDHGRKVGRNG